MDTVDLALDRPTPAALLTHWTVQPVAITLAALLAIGYVRGVRSMRAEGRPWSNGRATVFALGLVALLWTSCGPLQVYGDSLYWMWTTQALVLWLFVPILVLWGHPLQLARAVGGPSGRLERVLRSTPVRIVSNPLVGPALVPILSAFLFFGPMPGWAIGSAPAGWLLQLALLAIGGLMVLPLIGLDDDVSSLAVGLSLAIGSFELVIDAVPGIVLRLHNGIATSWFTHRAQHAWTPDSLHDQRVAGAILWCIAEIIDLPFLALVYRRWLRADARDAADVDAVLEAERAARHGLDKMPTQDSEPDPDAGRDVPWWISDPAMQRRLRHRD